MIQKTKIENNRKKNSLDDLARQTALDDKDLINNILNSEKPESKKDNKKTPKEKTIEEKIPDLNIIKPNSASILGDFLFYAVYNPENVATWSQVTNKKHKSVLFKKDLNASGRSEIFAVFDEKITALEYIPHDGLILGNAKGLVTRLSDVNLCKLTLNPGANDDRVISRGGAQINGLVYIPNLALFSSKQCFHIIIEQRFNKNFNNNFISTIHRPKGICYSPDYGLYGIEPDHTGLKSSLIYYINNKNKIDKILVTTYDCGEFRFISSYQNNKLLLGLGDKTYVRVIKYYSGTGFYELSQLQGASCAVWMDELEKIAFGHNDDLKTYSSKSGSKTTLDSVDGKITTMKYVRL